MRGWRHDYHTHIQTVKAYLALNQIKEANNFLQELEQDLVKVDSYVKSGNLMLDAILNSKISLADNKNIYVKCKANLPENISISDIDLCVILGNILDNAIEACEKIDENKRFIRIYISTLKNQLYISVQNSAKEELGFNEKNYITTKRGNHGLGMKRVKILVDKYEGYLNLQNEPGIFASEITIPLQ
ncbi:GHKL domain-containing protein [Sedimentibacter sp. zth1]|nr:GHKL domain-containing protein [Sedimentibacter sp. zth1]